MKLTKHILLIILSVAIFLGTTPIYADSLFEGTGTESDPFVISTKEDLAKLSSTVSTSNHYKGVYFKLSNDITLDNTVNWTPIGIGPNNYFGGIFDGDNHTIYGLHISVNDTYQGLFGYSSGTIKNVTIKDSDVSGTVQIGGICGENAGTIINCHNYGTITGSSISVGGICGKNDTNATISDCSNHGTITCTSNSENNVGGICGYSESTGDYGITDCFNKGKVTASGSFAGGILGYSISTKILNCSNLGEISGTEKVGAICGNSNQVSNCYYKVGTASTGIGSSSSDNFSKTMPFTVTSTTISIDTYSETGNTYNIDDIVTNRKLGLYPGSEHTLIVTNSIGTVTIPITTEATNTTGEYIDSTTTNYQSVQVVGHNVEFGNDLTLYYYAAYVPSDATNIRLYIERKFYGEDSTGTFKYYEITPCGTQKIGENDCYVFKFDGIAACEIGDDLTATVYFDLNNETYIGKADRYSIKTYAYNRLNSSESSDSFKMMLEDLLDYAAAAQTYFKYNTSYLVNADLSVTRRRTTDSVPANNKSETSILDNSTQKATMKGYIVSFENKTNLHYYFELDSSVNVDNLKITFTYTPVGYESPVTLAYTLSKDSTTGLYIATVSDISMVNIGSTISATIYEGETQISETYYYDIETYASRKLASSTSSEFKALLQKLVNYGNSAKTHFSK